MRPQQIRQGDVFLTPTATKPSRQAKRIEDAGRTILAYGEVTGHAHQIVTLAEDIETIPPAALFEEPDGTRHLLVDRPCLLRHEEHGPIALTPGCYRVVRQREYSPEEIRQVAD